jgi:DNA gyrase subunit A
MYRILVNDIPVGTNVTGGQSIKSLIAMETEETPTLIYSIYRDTPAKYILFVTKNGIIKKTALEEYVNTKKKTGVIAINLREGDSLASVQLVTDEDIILVTKLGMAIQMHSKDASATSRATVGVKGITLKPDDEVVSALVVRHKEDQLAVFSEKGLGKKIALSELPVQNRAGKGLIVYKPDTSTGNLIGAALVSDEDHILITGLVNSICISASEIPLLSRGSIGNQLIKGNSATSVSKV